MTTLSKLLRGSCAIATSGALMLSNFPAPAQDQPPPTAQVTPPAAVQPAAQQLGQGELERLLAPIALYPDDLVAQILTASTYPIEVVEAERWVSAHPNVQGDAVSNEMQRQPWDPSVKGLTAVPQVLAMMNDKLDWTQQLGEAFLAQPNDVSNAIQQLRAKAQANGNLKSSKEIKVSAELEPPGPPPQPVGPPPSGVDPAMLPPPPPNQYIMIEPVDPGVYYVPIYDPMVVYGPWGWAAYAPFYWYPPGYVVGAAVIGFGVGFFVGSALWAHYNWHGGGVTINVVNYNRFNHTNIVAGRNGFANWQFNAAHRGTVGFQNAALRQQFGGSTTFRGTQGMFHGGSLNTNVNANRTVNVNRNVDVNRNVNVNRNVDINRNVNANRTVNVNRNVDINRNVNANRNANVNQNLKSSANLNHPGNFTRGAGRTPAGRHLEQR